MLVFDLDDTLYLERDFAFSGFAYLERWVAEHYDVTGFGSACENIFTAGDRRKIFNTACALLGLPDTQEFIGRLVQEYRLHVPKIQLSPDVERFLNAASHPMGLITDGPERMQRNKIAALGLEQHFAHIRPTGAWPEGFGKPHPRAFEEMESLAPGGSKMVYIADNPAKDFVTPNAMGWQTVQVLRAGALHDPTPPDQAHAAQIRIINFDQLPDVIEVS